MADQIDVVIEVAYEILTDVLSCPPGVSDKFSLGHLVLHVRTGEINGEKDEGVAQNIHCICKRKERCVYCNYYYLRQRICIRVF